MIKKNPKPFAYVGVNYDIEDECPKYMGVTVDIDGKKKCFNEGGNLVRDAITAGIYLAHQPPLDIAYSSSTDNVQIALHDYRPAQEKPCQN